MEVYKIKGGNRLKGNIKVSGEKNSAVALIPATILADSPVTIDGLPEISDVLTLKLLMEEIGGTVTFENGKMTVDPTNMEAMTVHTVTLQLVLLLSVRLTWMRCWP